jgi:hypothetical protein
MSQSAASPMIGRAAWFNGEGHFNAPRQAEIASLNFDKEKTLQS